MACWICSSGLTDTVDAARGLVTRLPSRSMTRGCSNRCRKPWIGRTTIARFNQIASDIHQLTGDPNVQTDTEDDRAALSRPREGRAARPRTSAASWAAQQRQGRARFALDPQLGIDFAGAAASPFPVGLHLRFPVGQRNAFNLGLYDAAEQQQADRPVRERLGGDAAIPVQPLMPPSSAWFDWRRQRGTRVLARCLQTRTPELDARALINLNNDFSLWLGADSMVRNTSP